MTSGKLLAIKEYMQRVAYEPLTSRRSKSQRQTEGESSTMVLVLHIKTNILYQSLAEDRNLHQTHGTGRLTD
jgi:hypothetical protein